MYDEGVKIERQRTKEIRTIIDWSTYSFITIFNFPYSHRPGGNNFCHGNMI